MPLEACVLVAITAVDKEEVQLSLSSVLRSCYELNVMASETIAAIGSEKNASCGVPTPTHQNEKKTMG